MDPPSDRALLVALADRAGLSRAAVCRLGAELAEWRDAAGPDLELARRLSLGADSLSAALVLRADARRLAEQAERRAARLGAALLTLADPDYPPALRELPLPPPAIWISGALPEATVPAIAIVGSRRATPYGLEVAAWLGAELARAGLVVVSGFALGVDSAAHRGALRVAGGRTLAVLGCGLAVDYPRGQRGLGREIEAAGARLTEFPCDRTPEPWHFPVRNRLIAALSRGTIVVEAAPRSGSLITARLALDLGREVMATPGRITDELALGTNALIADGAIPVTHPDDVLEALGLAGGGRERTRPAARAVPRGLAPEATALDAALDEVDARAPEALAELARLPVDRALALLLELELAGHALRLPGGLYRRR